MKVRNIITIDKERCNGCGLCVTDCAEGAIAIIDGKATIISDMYCDGLGACLAACPQDALRIIQRAAEPFDEIAAMQNIEKQRASAPCAQPGSCELQAPTGGGFAQSMFNAKEPLACGCPGSSVKQFPVSSEGSCPSASGIQNASWLSGPGHWPLKLRLVQPNASFLENAHILVAADCAAAASPQFHQLAQGKVVLIACPKFEDTQALAQRLGGMLEQNTIQSLTLLRMEVPCCQGLASVCHDAVTQSGKLLVVSEVIMNCDGTPRL